MIREGEKTTGKVIGIEERGDKNSKRAVIRFKTESGDVVEWSRPWTGDEEKRAKVAETMSIIKEAAGGPVNLVIGRDKYSGDLVASFVNKHVEPAPISLSEAFPDLFVTTPHSHAKAPF